MYPVLDRRDDDSEDNGERDSTNECAEPAPTRDEKEILLRQHPSLLRELG